MRIVETTGGMVACLVEFNPHHARNGRFASKSSRGVTVREHYPHKNGTDQSVHAGAKARGGRSAALNRKLAAVESDIVKLDGGEIGVVLDKNGKELYRTQQMGDPDGPGPRTAGLSIDEEGQQFFRGNVFTHNHPRGGDSLELIRAQDTFSPDDIMSAAGMGVSEVRMVNDVSTHSIRPGPNGWQSTFEIDVTARQLAAFGAYDSRISFTRALANSMGWTYEVTPRA